MKKLFLLITLCLLVTEGFASELIFKADGSAMLATQKSIKPQYDRVAVPASKSDNYKAFADKFGDASIVVDKQTGNASAIICKPIELTKEKITKDNVSRICDEFLSVNGSALGVDAKSLKFASSNCRNGMWYVFYKQFSGDMEIINAGLTIRLRDGQTGYISMNYFPNPVLSSKDDNPSGGARNYLGAACQGLPFNPDRCMAVKEKYDSKIMVVQTESRIEFRKVFIIPFVIKNTKQAFISYVDAGSAELLKRDKKLYNERQFHAKGTIRMNNANSIPQLVNFEDVAVASEVDTVRTDKDGLAQIPDAMPESLEMTLNGNQNSMTIVDSLYNVITSFPFRAVNGMTEIDLDTLNTTIADRTVFYHARYFRSYIKQLDPEVPGFETPMPIRMEHYCGEYDSPNASYSPFFKEIAFNCINDPSYAYGECPDVLYHEYGHAVVENIFENATGDGLSNSTLHEAFADLMAAGIIDSPNLAIGSDRAYPDSSLRSCKNTMEYPRDVQNECHNDGMILSGAYWDLRELTNLEYFRKITQDVKYALIDGDDDGLCFQKVFLETLYLDDNDGNLLNGTPNMDKIIVAFGNHKIGAGFLVSSALEHAKVQSTSDTLNSIPVALTIQESGVIAPIRNLVSEAKLKYFTNEDPTIREIACQTNDKLLFQAQLPPQKPGTMVSYWFEMNLGGEQIKKIEYDEMNSVYKYMVGYDVAIYDGVEGSNWVFGTSEENEYNDVRWEFAIPLSTRLHTWYGTSLLQPYGNSRGEEKKCLVTGADSTSSLFKINEHFPAGRVSATSPEYNISNLKKPVFKCDYWYKTLRFASDWFYKTNPEFIIVASSDNGASWDTLHHVYCDTTNGWDNIMFDIKKYSPRIKLRFVVRSGQQFISNDKLETINYLAKGLLDNISIYNYDPEFKSTVEQLPEPGDIAITYGHSNDVIFALPVPAERAKLKIVNLIGEVVYSSDSNPIGEGNNSIRWNWGGHSQSSAANGVYFYEIVTESASYRGKFLIDGK